jgi:hypothetical protein
MSESVPPTEPATRAPAEEDNDPYPEQWKQGPEAYTPVHVNPLFLAYLSSVSLLIQQTHALSL